jgi:PST family polysaccharide transporter
MFLELLKLVLLFSCIIAFAPLGPLWTAASVGIAFGGHALVTIGLVVRTDRIPVWPVASAVLRPLAACGIMAAAVLGTRQAMLALGVDHPRALLPVEIVVGAAAYVAAALVVARPIALDVLQLLRRALRRGG